MRGERPKREYPLLRGVVVTCAIVLIWATIALATVPSKPYTFSANTVIQSSQVNADFDTLYSTLSANIDHTNIGSGGIYASQIIPDTSGHATFGGSIAYVFQNGLTINGGLTLGTALGVASGGTGLSSATTGCFGYSGSAYGHFDCIDTAGTGMSLSGTTLGIASGGVGQTQVSNGYVDLSSTQTVGGAKTFSQALTVTNNISIPLSNGSGLTVGSGANPAIFAQGPNNNVTLGIAGTATGGTIYVYPNGTRSSAQLQFNSDGNGSILFPSSVNNFRLKAGLASPYAGQIWEGDTNSTTAGGWKIGLYDGNGVNLWGALSAVSGFEIASSDYGPTSATVNGLLSATQIQTVSSTANLNVNAQGAGHTVAINYNSGADGGLTVYDGGTVNHSNYGATSATVVGLLKATDLQSNHTGTATYVPPVYTSNGSAVASTEHFWSTSFTTAINSNSCAINGTTHANDCTTLTMGPTWSGVPNCWTSYNGSTSGQGNPGLPGSAQVGWTTSQLFIYDSNPPNTIRVTCEGT